MKIAKPENSQKRYNNMSNKTYGKEKLTIKQMHSKRDDAIDAGHGYYFTGKPCCNGHIDVRRANDRRCLECDRLYYLRNREKIRTRQNEYNRKKASKQKKIYRKRGQSSPEARAAYEKEYYEKNKEKIRKYKQQYYQLNKEKYAIRTREWKRNNKERYAEQRRKLREKKKMLEELS